MDEDERQLESQQEDRTGRVRSPVSGLDSATNAGASVEITARDIFSRRTHRRVRSELPAYLMIQCSWFTAFGLQMVLFPYLITNRLGLNGTELGLANMALSAPSVIFLLIGGVIAAPFGAIMAKRFSPKIMLVLVGIVLTATSAYSLLRALS